VNEAALMRRALSLAARAKGNTSPNPMVGAVVVDEAGLIAGSGYHRQAGKPHAEVEALTQAAGRAANGTLYVTLEPCVHEGRTPPCVDLIVRSGISRVITCSDDPDERARGRGIARLRDAGVRVDVGLCEADARKLNRAYFFQRTSGRPYVTLKMAQSLDGAIGERPSERCQLTGERSAQFVRGLRHDYDMLMVGVRTVIIDDPLLNVRPFVWRAVPYVRIVVDSSGRTPPSAKLFGDGRHTRTLIACTSRIPAERRAALEGAGAAVMQCLATAAGRVDLTDLLARLGQQGTLSVLCEGGPTMARSLLENGCVNELNLLVAPLVLGTATIAPVIAGDSALNAAFRVEAVRRLGEDVWLNAVRKG
jgi:diaminohydroxyphosphoribosylaminopyrimidine deaminase/5-amino-6-(5-phosphoribosylamino)uracil reductase